MDEQRTTEIDDEEIPLLVDEDESDLPRGQRIAESIANAVGWKFLKWQTVVIALWIAMNITWSFHFYQWDPYPFILLNLMLSLQAAYTGPIMRVAQERTDRKMRSIAKDTNARVNRVDRRVSILHADHNTLMQENRDELKYMKDLAHQHRKETRTLLAMGKLIIRLLYLILREVRKNNGQTQTKVEE